MKILHTVDSLSIGGAERMSINIVNAINKDFESHLFVFRSSEKSLINSLKPEIKSTVLNKKFFFDFQSFIIYRKYVKDYKFDLIHAHSSTIIWALLLKITGLKIKILWHDHYGGEQLNKGLLRNLVKALSFLINFNISVNNNLLIWSKTYLPYTKKKFINNFPMLKTINKNQSRVKEVVLLANFREQKDHITFLKAIILLKEKKQFIVDFRLIGSFVDQEYTNKIKQYINDNKLTNQCKYFGPSQNVEKQLAQCMVGVLSSKSEGLPVSLLEYGMCGLLPITSDVGECKEVIGGFGYLFDSGDHISLAKFLFDSLNNQNKSNFLAEKFKLRINEYYGPVNFIKEYTKLIIN